MIFILFINMTIIRNRKREKKKEKKGERGREASFNTS